MTENDENQKKNVRLIKLFLSIYRDIKMNLISLEIDQVRFNKFDINWIDYFNTAETLTQITTTNDENQKKIIKNNFPYLTQPPKFLTSLRLSSSRWGTRGKHWFWGLMAEARPWVISCYCFINRVFIKYCVFP